MGELAREIRLQNHAACPVIHLFRLKQVNDMPFTSRARVWNEHVKMLATLLNAIAIGILGVAVIGPLAQPSNPFFGFSDGVEEKLNGLVTTLRWYDVVRWKAIGLAILIHGVAQFVLRGMKDE